MKSLDVRLNDLQRFPVNGELFEKCLNMIATMHIQGHVLLIGNQDIKMGIQLGLLMKHNPTLNFQLYWLVEENSVKMFDLLLKNGG